MPWRLPDERLDAEDGDQGEAFGVLGAGFGCVDHEAQVAARHGPGDSEPALSSLRTASGTSPDRCRPGWGNDYFFPFLPFLSFFLLFLLFLATPITPLPGRKVNEMLTEKRQRIIDRYRVSNRL
jgi:hypothetical protein